MNKRITVDEYFRMPETNRSMDLVYGFVREPDRLCSHAWRLSLKA